MPCSTEGCGEKAMLGMGRTEEEAQRIAKGLVAIGTAHGLCPKCGRWHLYVLRPDRPGHVRVGIETME